MDQAQVVLSTVTIAVVLLSIFMDNQRLNSVEVRLYARVNSLESKLDTKLDLLTGKVFELDTRLSRIEEQLRR